MKCEHVQSELMSEGWEDSMHGRFYVLHYRCVKCGVSFGRYRQVE